MTEIDPVQHSGGVRKPRGDRSPAITKWILFGVALPLLPILSRTSAEWIDQGQIDLSMGHLFGDGELLVIATVIAAAGIGDLVFDLKRSRRHRGFKDSLTIAFALFCVIISVLLYALITLKKEQLTPQQQEVSTSINAQRATVEQYDIKLASLQGQLNQLQQKFEQASAAANKEFNGQVSIKVPGDSVEYKRLVAVAQSFNAQIVEVNQQIKDVTAAANSSEQTLSKQQLEQAASLNHNGQIATSYSDLRAADASIFMFALSLIAGASCVVVGSGRRKRPRSSYARQDEFVLVSASDQDDGELDPRSS